MEEAGDEARRLPFRLAVVAETLLHALLHSLLHLIGLGALLGSERASLYFLNFEPMIMNRSFLSSPDPRRMCCCCPPSASGVLFSGTSDL